MKYFKNLKLIKRKGEKRGELKSLALSSLLLRAALPPLSLILHVHTHRYTPKTCFLSAVSTHKTHAFHQFFFIFALRQKSSLLQCRRERKKLALKTEIKKRWNKIVCVSGSSHYLCRIPIWLAPRHKNPQNVLVCLVPKHFSYIFLLFLFKFQITYSQSAVEPAKVYLFPVVTQPFPP